MKNFSFCNLPQDVYYTELPPKKQTDKVTATKHQTTTAPLAGGEPMWFI